MPKNKPIIITGVSDNSLELPLMLKNKMSPAEKLACQLEVKICIAEAIIRDKYTEDKKRGSIIDYDEKAQVTMKNIAFSMYKNPETKKKLLLQLDLLAEIGVDEDAFVKSVAVQRFTKNDTSKFLQLSNSHLMILTAKHQL